MVTPASTKNLSALGLAVKDGDVPMPTFPKLSKTSRCVLLVRKRRLTLSVVPTNLDPELVPLLPPVSQLPTVVPNVCQDGLVVVPVFTWKALIVVLKMINPVAGKGIALTCAAVILGNRKPLLVLLTSSMALVSGRLPVAFSAIFCEKSFDTVTN